MTVPLDLAYPFTGSWEVRNSPANRVPSHGSRLFATEYAIDFVPVDDSGRTAPFTLRSLVRTEAPEEFPGFGRHVLAPVDGVVVGTLATLPDHSAHRGFRSIGYALTQRRRAAAGWTALAGNHVLLECRGGIVALCHLQEGSVRVRSGQRVAVGQVLGGCGNSGNSVEPHLHVQVIDRRDIERARPVPVTFDGRLPANGDIIRPQ
ncbi:M23 family metallopeptidase [Brevibacterium senegalense]|uniref:M23 family metallopeptidase n=1 Tax=Brevibacterium senegalense TaxID=1033736 RepID=UPI00031C2D61|nr:M23 family metallopeptidase [Brevibacterium senegalense]